MPSEPTLLPAPRAADELSGDVSRALAGQFAIERELGRGGMGVVYLARDLKLERHVALKVLPAPLSLDAVTRERFLREARTAAQLSHPNVVPVYRADELHGVAFFAMAYVDGESLAERVRDRGALPAAEAVRILREVAWALAYAHARGVVHRDVKPENIMLERGTGRALVTDFGIAHRADVEAARLTLDGHVMGTLHFMSPEQATGAPLDGRSDLYALGVVAYHVLSGRLPFGDLAGPAVLVAHATRPAPPLRSAAPDVPASLAAVVDRCLAKDPAERFATGEALADALERALAEAPAAARASGPSLPADLPAVLSEVQAAAIWRRAAQLQADALRRLEERRELLPRAGDAAAATSGYRAADVAQAAEEAGISRQYVAMAMAELPRGDSLARAGGEMRIGEREATLFLGTQERSLAVTQRVDAPPARVLRVIGAVLQQSPYELMLRETVGAHPLDGGVIVFDLPGPVIGLGGAPASALNTYWLGTHHQLEARQVQVTLRAVDDERTEVTMTCDLRVGVRRNVRVSQGLAAGIGATGATLTGAILAKGPAIAASLAVLGPAAAAGLGITGLMFAWYRWLYPSVLRKSRAEMQRALQAVAAAVQAEHVFGALPAPQRRARESSGGDDLVTMV